MEFILEFKTATATKRAGEQIKVTAAEATIGRDNNCDVQFDESCSTVSRQHAKIVLDGGRYKIVALSQTNSTYVNGTPVKGERYLNNGDEVKFSSQGPTVIFKVNDPRATQAVDPAATRTINNVATARTVPPTPAAPRPAAPAPAPAPKKKSNMPVIIAAVVVLAAVVGGVLFFLNKDKKAETVAVEAKAPVLTIESCYNSVYFVKVDDISVYEKSTKALYTTISTTNIISGTGFMLDNGKFVTAKSVIEPWIVANGVVGSGADKRVWTYDELQKAGYEVVTNCTAYTSAGTSFKFANTDCVISQDGSDWVTLAKKDQLATVGGLACDADWSLSPQHGTECQIVGYLPNTDIQKLQPSVYKNAVNVTELNKDYMIELSSQRWQSGLSGSPVVIEKGGKFVVVGIMTKSNIADRDVCVPIANAIK